MKKINIKSNIRQLLTDKTKTQKESNQIISISNPNYNFIKPINSHTSSNKNINKISLLNSLKGRENKKITKLIENNNLRNIKNINYNFKNNNSLMKEVQNDYNNFRKSKTTEKPVGNNINLLMGYQENQANNNNKKIMIKQNKMRKFNLSVSKIPKYDNSLFKQAMKYYTIKSESKTIQIEELSTYLRPIRNILGFSNGHKIKTQNNINSSINIHNNIFKDNNSNSNYNDKNILNNSHYKNNSENLSKDYNTIAHDDNNEQQNKNEKENENKNVNISHKEMNEDVIFDNNNNNQMSNCLIKNNNILNNHTNSQTNLMINDKNNVNDSLIKNCVFNNIPHTYRNSKNSQIPFSIKIDKIDNAKNGFNTNEKNKNKENINIIDSTNNNILNSKNLSENETQISTNNNINNLNQDNNKTQQSQSQTLYQFRPRKMHLPKTVINLSSMHFKNQILQNILNKRKQIKTNNNLKL